jgi:electron transfer flavoprotein alpha subunit
MANDILVLADHLRGQLSDPTLELVGKAKELAGATGGQVVVALLGAPDLAGQIAGADVVLTMDHPALSDYTPEAWEKALLHIVNERQPRLVLIANTTIGMDLGAGLSGTWGAPLVAYTVRLDVEGDSFVATAQVYGGKLLAEVEMSGERGICTVVAGSFPAAAAGGGSPATEAIAPPAGLDDLKTSFLTMVEPQAGDVDITGAEILVSVGRGIGSQDNLEEVQELADALGAPLSASRPITDAGWLPKTRQVGKSGLKVKPKVYLTFGISGAPEHLEGMRDAELIIACNTDAAAPIFDVAHYGTTIDLFDLVPAISDKVG